MGCSQKLFFFTAFLVFAAAIDGALGAATVTGTVFCDQCKDGQVSLFDYPLQGIKVRMTCPGSDGQLEMYREETTNWLGTYSMRFDGAPDLSSCYTQVSGIGQGQNGCGAAVGPAKNLKLMFNVFDMEMYTVDPLIAQPAEPMPFCPRSAIAPAYPPPVVRPPAPLLSPPLPQLQPPSLPQLQPPPLPQLQPPQLQPPLPQLQLPPLPQLQPPPLPQLQPPPLPQLPPLAPLPYLEDSACPHQQWMMPEHRCYWKVVKPDTKVAVVFGLIAGRQYGPDMTLGQGMSGRGDPYRTLLREGTTALLNSYNSIQFPYNTLDVIQRMNWALIGSNRHVLRTAWIFMRANSGADTNATCRFTTCK